MAVRHKTPFTPNKIYFLTFTAFRWHNFFTNDKYCDLIYKWFDYTKDNYGNKIHGYVIMPNHIHVLMYISDRSPRLSVLIQNAKRFLAYQIINYLKEDNNIELLNNLKTGPNKNKAKHQVFQPRYDSLMIYNTKIFLQKLDYIHHNPCQPKWSLAEKPEDYRYSSAANYLADEGNYKVDVIDL
jgi:REP element-mobilizing transposase RayT